jgi:hypothetical protein
MEAREEKKQVLQFSTETDDECINCGNDARYQINKSVNISKKKRARDKSKKRWRRKRDLCHIT